MEDNKINPEHAKAFEELFGPDAKGGNVEIRDPRVQKKMDDMSMPIPLKLCNSFFGLLLTIFTKILPISIVGGLVLKEILINDYDFSSLANTLKLIIYFIIPKIFYMVIIACIFWVVLQTLNYFVQFFIVKIYEIQLKKLVKECEANENAIKDHLKSQDKKDDEQQERNTFSGYTKEEILQHAKEAVAAEEAKRAQDK